MAAYLAARDGFRCGLCRGPFGQGAWRITIDHILPRSRGGTLHPANLRLAHAACNQQRGAEMPPPEIVERIVAESRRGIREAWADVGIQLDLRRAQRRSRFVRRLRKEGHLSPGDVALAVAVLLATAA
jgi:hypothetical protein